MKKLIRLISLYTFFVLATGCVQKEVLNEKPANKKVEFNINLDIGGSKNNDSFIENMGDCLSFTEIKQLTNAGDLFVKVQLSPLVASDLEISYEFNLPIRKQLINGKLQTASISISGGEYSIRKAALYSKRSESSNQLLYTALTTDSKYAIYIPEGKRLDEFTFTIPEGALHIVNFDIWMICYTKIE